MTDSQLQTWQAACDRLLDNQQTLLLASRAADGHADISYAPYLSSDGKFYIFVSELAKHTQNLLRHPKTSVMFIEPENQAANVFARQRLTLECQVQEITRIDPHHDAILEAMAAKFGEIFDLLRSLPDFHLLALTPAQGQFVAGFGKTFAVDAHMALQAKAPRH